MKKLPKKMSALLRLAVRDAQACESDPRYELHMDTWHSASVEDNGVCFVCMAGAVMAKTQDIPIGKVVAHPTDSRFYYIDCMRSGKVVGATCEVAEKFSRIIMPGFIPRLGRADWTTYLRAADYLESEGL